MTNFTARPAPSRRSHENAAPTKTPRTDLVLLEVDADDCPQVLLRVLGQISRDGSIPVTIKASRTEDGVAIAVELDRTCSIESERIAIRVRQIPTVREVRLGGRRIT